MSEFRIYTVDAPMNDEQKERILSLMKDAFPTIERRTDEGQRMLFHHPLYQIHTLEDNGTILAFMAAWQLPETTFLEHFAVDHSRRGAGLGGRFLDRLLAESKRSVVLEVELPESETARRRINFYQRHGMRLNKQFYQQPPLKAGDEVIPLFLMSWPGALSDDEFIRTRKEIYYHVYKTEI